MHKNFQNSLGVLNRYDIDVDIASINYLRHIPNFTTPSTVNIPLLAKSNDKFFCLSGEELVHNAISKKQKTIHCLVEDHGNGSMLELSFRKVSFRMVPEGGRCSYGEKVRAIKSLEMLIRDSVENITANGHGGNRRSVQHNNDGNDLATMIVKKLQLDRDTVNTYLHYAKYLDYETLNFFAVEKVKKSFFEKAQIPKRKLITELQEKSTSNEDITSQVSTKMMAWYRSFNENNDRIIDPVETITQNEQNIPETNNIENENQEMDNVFEEKEATDSQIEAQYSALTVVPKNPAVADPANETSKQIDAQIRRVIVSLTRSLGEGVDSATKCGIIAQAINDLLQISPAGKEAVNG